MAQALLIYAWWLWEVHSPIDRPRKGLSQRLLRAADIKDGDTISISMTDKIWDNTPMSTTQKPISISDAVSPEASEPDADVRASQMRKIAERQKSADEGRFASTNAVRTIIRKFIPNG